MDQSNPNRNEQLNALNAHVDAIRAQRQPSAPVDPNAYAVDPSVQAVDPSVYAATTVNTERYVEPKPERRRGRGGILLAGAVVLAAVAGYALADRGSDDGRGTTADRTEDTSGAGGVETTLTPEQQTAADKAFNDIFNPSDARLKEMDCLADPNIVAWFGREIKTDEFGHKTIPQILPSYLAVDRSLQDPYHRDSSDADSSPFTANTTDTEALMQNLAVSYCAEPVALGAMVHNLMSSNFAGINVGENATKLKPLAGLSAESITAMLTYSETDSPEHKLDISNYRMELAEYVVTVLKGLEATTVEDVPMHSDYALDPVSAMNPAGPVKFVGADYVGDAMIFSYTQKGVLCFEYSFGVNTGTTNIDEEGGDKRPVEVIEDVCEIPPVVTTPEGSTPDSQVSTTTPVITTPQTTIFMGPKDGTVVIAGDGAGATQDGVSVDRGGIGEADQVVDQSSGTIVTENTAAAPAPSSSEVHSSSTDATQPASTNAEPDVTQPPQTVPAEQGGSPTESAPGSGTLPDPNNL